MEVIAKLIQLKRFVNRGFLIGPYCPIYGVGGLLVTLLLTRFNYNIVMLFVMSIVLFSILEYFTSYFLEKIFKARWWDYSRKRFNINGRICLNTMIIFGLLGCILIRFINPILFKFLYSIDYNTLTIVFIIIFILFIVDVIISTNTIYKIKIYTKFQDNTEEITKKVREILINKSVLAKRIIEAYPNFKMYIENKVQKQINKIRNKNK
jgi:uncharacterized membrane protein